MTKKHHFVLSVLVWQEEGAWIAQALEHDFCAHGISEDAAVHSLGRVIVTHMQLSKASDQSHPLGDVKSAPDEFWEAWGKAEQSQEATRLADGDGLPGAYALLHRMPHTPSRFAHA